MTSDEPISREDGTHGRLEGDLRGVLGTGVTFLAGASRWGTEARLRYAEMGGLLLAYEETLPKPDAEGIARLGLVGIEVRPLFWGRWLQGMESGRKPWDLFVDSLGLEMAAGLGQREQGPFGGERSLHLALGLEVPLGLSLDGPWVAVRGGYRWPESIMAGTVPSMPPGQGAFVSISLAWHQTLPVSLSRSSVAEDPSP